MISHDTGIQKMYNFPLTNHFSELGLGGCWRPPCPLCVDPPQWSTWVVATTHQQCHLWSLPSSNLVPSWISWLWPFGGIIERTSTCRGWCYLQGVYCSAWSSPGASKLDTTLARVWRNKGCCQWNVGIPQQKIQPGRWVYGEWWKDPMLSCLKLLFWLWK